MGSINSWYDRRAKKLIHSGTNIQNQHTKKNEETFTFSLITNFQNDQENFLNNNSPSIFSFSDKSNYRYYR